MWYRLLFEAQSYACTQIETNLNISDKCYTDGLFQQYEKLDMLKDNECKKYLITPLKEYSENIFCGRRILPDVNVC